MGKVTTAVVLLVLSGQVIAGERLTARPVACVHGTPIYSDELMIPAGANQEDGRDGLSISERIHKLTQWSLDRELISALLAGAVDLYGIVVTEDEVMNRVPAFVRDERAYRQSWEPMLAVPRAARRVRLGASPDSVYAEDLARYRDRGITPEYFRRVLGLFNSVEKADRFLSVDQVANARAAQYEQARQTLILERLRELAVERAHSRAIELAAAKTEVWQELLDALQVEVLDPSFQLPSWKGVF